MSKKIVDYKIVVENNIHDLADTVKGEIKKGWQPIGGIAIEGPLWWYYQALIKYAPVKKRQKTTYVTPKEFLAGLNPNKGMPNPKVRARLHGRKHYKK